MVLHRLNNAFHRLPISDGQKIPSRASEALRLLSTPSSYPTAQHSNPNPSLTPFCGAIRFLYCSQMESRLGAEESSWTKGLLAALGADRISGKRGVQRGAPAGMALLASGVFLGVSTICALCAIPILQKERAKPGHGLFDSEKPQEVELAQEEARRKKLNVGDRAST